jgi:hypothetical protein
MRAVARSRPWGRVLGPRLGGLFAERQMGSGLVAAGEARLEDPKAKPLTEDDDMLEASSPYQAHEKHTGRGAHQAHPPLRLSWERLRLPCSERPG